jgi:hypothetical protein
MPSSSQTWATFLKNHARDIWACDFTVAYDWFFRPWYVFVVMELKTRRGVHTAITKSPTNEWTAQQLREATPWGKDPKYLLHDRDSKYSWQQAHTSKSLEHLIQRLVSMAVANGLWAACEENAWTIHLSFMVGI